MPFISEELWQDLAPRGENETIMYAKTPVSKPYDQSVLDDFALAAEAINGVRGVRSQRNIAPKERLHLMIKGNSFPAEVLPLVEKLALADVEKVDGFGDAQGIGFLVKTHEMMVELQGLVNVEEEIEKSQKELEHLQNFLAGVRAKLSNERFTAHAPEAVVAMERKKESDALSKIEILEKKINQLKTNK
jgi:valyl-tRNA synthetase